jgi:hypothetical protein
MTPVPGNRIWKSPQADPDVVVKIQASQAPNAQGKNGHQCIVGSTSIWQRTLVFCSSWYREAMSDDTSLGHVAGRRGGGPTFRTPPSLTPGTCLRPHTLRCGVTAGKEKLSSLQHKHAFTKWT